MAKKRQTKSEFRRTNLKQGLNHPTYIYARVGDDYRYLGITHAKITEGVRNIPLEKNPNPKDKKAAYVRPDPQQAHRASFGARLQGWSFSDSDKAKIKKMKK